MRSLCHRNAIAPWLSDRDKQRVVEGDILADVTARTAADRVRARRHVIAAATAIATAGVGGGGALAPHGEPEVGDADVAVGGENHILRLRAGLQWS